MTRREIIEETIAYYSVSPDRRSRMVEKNKSGGSTTFCLYKGPEGQKCAFSRCCKEESLSELIEKKGCDSFSVEGSLDHLLQEKYHGHHPHFWMSLQRLHDYIANWSEDGSLSKMGKVYVNDMCKSFGEKIIYEDELS